MRGPPLGLIYGRIIGSDLHYKSYSDSVMRLGFIWNSQNLFKWIKDPQKVAPGTSCRPSEEIDDDGSIYDLVKFIKEFTLVNYNSVKMMVFSSSQ